MEKCCNGSNQMELKMEGLRVCDGCKMDQGDSFRLHSIKGMFMVCGYCFMELKKFFRSER